MVATKYPIILVHGIFMKPRFFHVFDYISKRLRNVGYSVYVADTDGVGNIENNAVFLKSQINDVLKTEGAEKVNIIAHSKGGLESIYMIRELDMGHRVASLTTLSTPYRGSAVASWVNRLPAFVLSAFVFVCNSFYKILGDNNPDLRTALRQLNRNDNFEETDLSVNYGVYCRSYSSTMKNASSDFVLSIPFIISTHYEKDFSDGMVSRESSRFADYKGDCIEGSFSHNEIVCYLTRKKKKKMVVDFYLNLCRDLTENGF